MPLTTIKGSNIDAVLTNTQLNTTGTASSANVLPGTFVWSSSSRTGLTNYAASDPATPAAGDVWYQTGNVKVASNQNLMVGIWRTSGNLNSNRQGTAAAGVIDAATIFCGSGPLATSELYNGTTWTNNANSMLVGRYFPSTFGTGGAALVFGGNDGSRSATSEEWDGLCASAGGSLSVAQQYACGAGSLSAGISIAGEIDTGNAETIASQEYNGTSWSAAGNLTTARYANYGCGTQTAALTWSGRNAPSSLYTSEEYNGTSWSAGGTVVPELKYGNSQMGTQSAALSAGSETAPKNMTQEYDGTAWTAGSILLTGRREGGSAGGQSGGLYAGGNDSSATNETEEWTKSQLQYYDV